MASASMTAMSSQLSPRIFLRNGVTLSVDPPACGIYIGEAGGKPEALEVRLPAVRQSGSDLGRRASWPTNLECHDKLERVGRVRQIPNIHRRPPTPIPGIDAYFA